MKAPRTVVGAAAALLAVGTSAGAVGSTKVTDQAWERWYRDLRTACPAHHVDWMYEAAFPYLYGGFNRTLTPSERRRVQHVADVERQCADESVGHSCELGRHLEAYRALGLAESFVRYTCRHVRCEDGALCSRAPGQR